MNSFHKYLPILFTLFLGAGTLTAQDGLPTEEVDVVKSFDARLLDTERIRLRPELPPLDTVTKRQSYNVISRAIEVDYLPPKIRPLGMKKDEVQKGYNGFARLGAGIPTSFYGEAGYNFVTNENLDLGVDVYHHSANNNRQVENQKFRNTNLGLNGTYYFDQGFAVNARSKYTNNAVFFYGYNDINEEEGTEYTFEPEEVRQRFAIFDLGGNIFNGERTEADFNYSAGIDLYFMQDNYAARENGLNLTIEGTKWFDGANPLTLKLITDFTTLKDTAKQNLNNFYLQPSYTYHGGTFKAKIGVNIVSSEDNFSFFPDVELTANIAEGILGIYVGADGSLQKNTFRNLTDYNPFIQSRIAIRNTKYYHFYGGVKGNISGYDYNAELGYKTTDNLALYQLADPLDPIVRFDVLYDTVQIFQLKGSINAPVFPGIELEGAVSQSIFTTENEEKAWHLPTFTVNAAIKYSGLEDQLRVRADFFLENGVPYRDAKGETANLNGLFDLSLGAEYFLTDQIGLFIQLNNLANNRRQRWHHYPTLGLNALVGISAKF